MSVSTSTLAAKTRLLRRRLRTVSMSSRTRFETRAPSPQTAIDAIPGTWAFRFPAPLDHLQAGQVENFDDDRIRWAFERFGGLERHSVVELGPLEGAHTFMLQHAGASRVVAVEANREAFLKCLVTKELLGLDRCEFLCGDAIAYLEDTDEHFDVCLASGFLYHLTEPVRAISAISDRASKLIMWTHVYDHSEIAGTSLARRFSSPATCSYAGFEHQVHRHRYGIWTHLAGFWGGTEAYSNWLTREDLFGALSHFGWREVQVSEERHVNGPALTLTATRA